MDVDIELVFILELAAVFIIDIYIYIYIDEVFPLLLFIFNDDEPNDRRELIENSSSVYRSTAPSRRNMRTIIDSALPSQSLLADDRAETKVVPGKFPLRMIYDRKYVQKQRGSIPIDMHAEGETIYLPYLLFCLADRCTTKRQSILRLSRAEIARQDRKSRLFT